MITEGEIGEGGKKSEELKARTKQFALRIIELFRALPRTPEAQIMGKQLLRCGTSVAAIYRAVCRSRSKAEFVAKLGVVVEEADESVFWIEMLEESGTLPEAKLVAIAKESRELAAIFTASHFTSRQKK